MLKIPGLIIVMLLGGATASCSASHPNVVIIYADDMGYGDMGANNSESKIPTPNLDRLAAEGMRFTDAHSSSGICTPSRFAMLTGQHHWRRFHGIVSSFGKSVFEPNDFTLAKMFSSMGYETACVGKWHLGWDWPALLKPGVVQQTYTDHKGRTKTAHLASDYDWSKPVPDGPLAQGFGYYFGDGTINFPPYCWIENNRILNPPTVMMDTELFRPIPEGQWEFRPGPMVEGWDPFEVLTALTDKAVDWIGRQKDGTPFFLYFALPSPHAPIIPQDAFRGKSKAGPYGDYVYQTDVMIGRVLKALEGYGFAGNTLVVFSADNGPERYAYDRLKNYSHWSSGLFRGVKRDVFEGGHHVPFLVRWPGRVEAGAVTEEVVSQVDLAATFASIVGYNLAPTEAIDSYNLMPVLEGRTLEGPLRKATVQNTYDDVYALRQGDWIFIDGPTGYRSEVPEWYDEQQGYAADTTPGLLYNLKEDVTQRHNLYERYPEKITGMKALLERYKNGEGCAPHSVIKR